MEKESLTNESLASYIGSKIRQFRKESGKTMTDVAGYLGKSQPMFTNYEKGK